ncbi:uncharacterized protein LOC123506347 isoform X10 [Portunus trituberculatus]|uniref:uncharacterized protein LOC123506347 isoform X10 n=1 Tax=Portunus trituberculatus TaxID=210409 RepID=UPI001E1D1719|nr:uncharacterized protein LOC123506347 isoform X10 [Portunus trituberculatus]
MEARHAPQQATAAPKPLVFTKMEALVKEMQDPETGVPIRSQKLFLTSIPSAFMGYDLIEWLLERLEIEDSAAEAIHLANLLCQYGYFFPVGESRSLIVKDDSSLYRFQTPYYWPSQNHSADTTDYAIYLTKRLSRNKQKHGLEDYELDAYNKLKKALAHKWDFITMQAEEQVKLAKDRKKGDKIVTDSQERAYWRVYRPPPGFTNCLETAPVPDKTNMANRVRKKTLDDLKKEKKFLESAVDRTRQKLSQVAESLLSYTEIYYEYDPLLNFPQPSNPWHSDEDTYWALNDGIVEVPTEKRVRRWGLSMEELISDVMGQSEFAAYLRKEYCHENIRFVEAVQQLRWGPTSDMGEKVKNIYEEFLKPGAPCEINIDGKTMELTQLLMKEPNRFTYDLASEHVYVVLLKKDCYPRFLRSEQYKTLLANALQPSQKKSRFFSFGGPGKKKISTPAAPNNVSSQALQPLKRHGSDDQAVSQAGLGPHGSSGLSADNAGGVHLGGPTPKVDCDPPYSCAERQSLAPAEVSHSNTVCPWDNNAEATAANICPWETSAPPPTSTARSNQPTKLDQRLTNPKIRPDRSKSVDVSSLGKRQGSVSQAPSLDPVPSEGYPAASVCPWENQELPNRTTEKSKSIDVDVCPWETNESAKKSSTSSAPGVMAGDQQVTSTSGMSLPGHPEHSDKTNMAIVLAVKEKGSKDVSRPPCERKISIQVCPWEEVEEEDSQTSETHSSSHSDKAQGKQPCDESEVRTEKATKPKEKYMSESYPKPESLPMQTPLETRQGVGSEGTSSPSSTCSSSSYSDSRKIKIDYTVRSGHLPGQYGLPITPIPAGSAPPVSQQPQHGHAAATATTTLSSGNISTTSSSSSTAGGHHVRAESPRGTDKLLNPAEGGSKPTSPRVATNVVAPWEENPPQKMTDICPWEDEESCKVDTPFVKTYATLGYL